MKAAPATKPSRLGRTAALAIKIRPDIKAAAEEAAVALGVSFTAWVEGAMRTRLEAEGGLPKPKAAKAPAKKPGGGA